MTFVIDASVYVSAALPLDINHADSEAALRLIDAAGDAIYCPALVLSECGGAIARPTRDPALAIGTVHLLMSIANLTIVETTSARAQEAALIAANHFLRGADALYVQVAHEFGATLLSWDGEMLLRSIALIPTMRPSDLLASQSAGGP
jgi:Predicted nucleic acid-binding protein, contains PIN domain